MNGSHDSLMNFVLWRKRKRKCEILYSTRLVAVGVLTLEGSRDTIGAGELHAVRFGQLLQTKALTIICLMSSYSCLTFGLSK
jgi:hypothetical protein